MLTMTLGSPGIRSVAVPALRQAGQHRLEGHLQLAKPLPVGGRGEGELGIAGALRGFVGAEFSRDPGEVLRPAQAAPDQRVVVGERAETGVADRAVRVPLSSPVPVMAVLLA